VKHLSLYAIATVNTAPQPTRDRPHRAKRRVRPAAWFRPFKATPRVDSREALA
jgi:hypothetical protein